MPDVEDHPWASIYQRLTRYPLIKGFCHVLIRTVYLTWLILQSIWLHLCAKNKYAHNVNAYIKHHLEANQSTLVFLKTLVLNPKATGAILPSSRILAKAMVEDIRISIDGCVVELGAGTGVMTKAMLQKGIHPSRIIAIEYSPALVAQLREDVIYHPKGATRLSP